jgi:hypothetical protein
MFRPIHVHIPGHTKNQELFPEEQDEESFQLSTEIERPLSLTLIRGCSYRYLSHSTRNMLSQLHAISAPPLQEFRSPQSLPIKETLLVHSTNAITAMMISVRVALLQPQRLFHKS